MVGVVVTYDIDTTYAVINKIHQSYIVKQMYKIRPTYANLHGSWHFRTYYKKTKVPRNKRLRRPLPTLQHYILNITVAHKIRNIGSLTLLNLLPLFSLRQAATGSKSISTLYRQLPCTPYPPCSIQVSLPAVGRKC